MNSTDNQDDPITKEKWYREWRGVAAYVYLAICLNDFMLAPILGQIWSWWVHVPYVVWVPLTVQGGGLFHVSFGAILGVSAWGKYIENRESISKLPDYSNYYNSNQYGQQPYQPYGQQPYQPPYQPPIDPLTGPNPPLGSTNGSPPPGPVRHHKPLGQ